MAKFEYNKKKIAYERIGSCYALLKHDLKCTSGLNVVNVSKHIEFKFESKTSRIWNTTKH